MRKPNYGFERAERERQRAAKADAKARRKAEMANAPEGVDPMIGEAPERFDTPIEQVDPSVVEPAKDRQD